MISMISAIGQYLEKGHARTVKARKNVLLSVLARGGGLLIGLLYFPISLSYLGQARFGIFLTLTSMVDWFRDFDVGIGNGLRNKVGEALADGDDDLARGYISTAYFFLGSLIIAITVLFIAGTLIVPWTDWLDTNAITDMEVTILLLLIFAAFSIRFVCSLVYQLFYALQRAGIVDLFQLIGKVIFLGLILILVYFTESSLILFGAVKSFTFAAVPLGVGIYFFNRSFKKFSPAFRWAKKSLLSSLFSLGSKFFVIKVSMIVIFQTNSLLIAGLLSVELVAEYQAAYKYLYIFLVLFNILTAQLWGANIEAYHQGDIGWMRKSMKAVEKIWFASLFLAAFMVLISPYIYYLWLQDKMQVSMLLSTIVALSICCTTWVNIFNLVLNGTGKINLQMYTWIAACILNIPLSIFFARVLDLGVIGIEIGTIVCLIPLMILSPIQVKKILQGKEAGIWAR